MGREAGGPASGRPAHPPSARADDGLPLPSARQKPKEDFEALLQSLSLQIQERQQRLSEIKLRERRATLAFTLYALALWLAYAVLWWFDGLAPLVRLGALLASGWSSGSSSSSSSAADGEAFHDDDGEGENELLRRGGNVLLALPAFVGPVGCVGSPSLAQPWLRAPP